jgi:hypothetical protein
MSRLDHVGVIRPPPTAGPIIITVETVDVPANTVTGTSVPERAPGTLMVWAGAPTDFDSFERLG